MASSGRSPYLDVFNDEKKKLMRFNNFLILVLKKCLISVEFIILFI